MNTKEHNNYISIFYPNGFVLDDSMDFLLKENIKDSMEKNRILSKILKNKSFLDMNFVNKLKKCLPNGFNSFGSFSDEEFILLKKEFNIKN